MKSHYVVVDGLGIAYWIEGDYWSADREDAQVFTSRMEATRAAESEGLESYRIQSVTDEIAEAC